MIESFEADRTLLFKKRVGYIDPGCVTPSSLSGEGNCYRPVLIGFILLQIPCQELAELSFSPVIIILTINFALLC